MGEGESAGVYVAAGERTYFLAGSRPDATQQVISYPYGAVPGTGVTTDGARFGTEFAGRIAAWMSKNGVFCLGLPGGRVQTLTEGRLALPEYSAGASLLRDHDGIRQWIMSLKGAGTAAALGATDSVTATVTRNGIEL